LARRGLCRSALGCSNALLQKSKNFGMLNYVHNTRGEREQNRNRQEY